MHRIIIIALLLRLLNFADPFIAFDSYEYYHNSKNLEVWDEAKEHHLYDRWYERTPAYVLFLHLTGEYAIPIQIILSTITVLLVYKINPIAGWLLCFYPVHILGANQYMKETLMIFFIAVLVYWHERN